MSQLELLLAMKRASILPTSMANASSNAQRSAWMRRIRPPSAVAVKQNRSRDDTGQSQNASDPEKLGGVVHLAAALAPTNAPVAAKDKRRLAAVALLVQRSVEWDDYMALRSSARRSFGIPAVPRPTWPAMPRPIIARRGPGAGRAVFHMEGRCMASSPIRRPPDRKPPSCPSAHAWPIYII